MAWTTPPTFAAAATLTAAQLNILSDDLNFLKNMDYAKAYNSAALTFTTATWKLVTYGSESADNGGLHSTVTNTGRLTVATDGWYIATAQLKWVANATGGRFVQVRKNDSSTDASLGTSLGFGSMPGISGSQATVVCVAYDYLVAGDYVTSYGSQTSGGNLDNVAGAESTWFALTRMTG